MIDYIVYGEFDINEGNVVQIEYPQKTGVNETILASYLIPEGAHNIMSDTFCFIINRKNLGEQSTIQGIKKAINSMTNLRSVKYLNFSDSTIFKNEIEKNGFPLKEIYNLDPSSKEKWNRLNATETLSKEKTIYLRIWLDEKEKIYKLVIYNMKSQTNLDDIDEIFNIPIHTDIQFQRLSPVFASVYTLNCQGIGFEFVNEGDLSKLTSLFGDTANIKERYAKSEETAANSAFSSTSDIINRDEDIYFLCTNETKLDKTQKRGAILKSIAIGTTKLVNLASFSSACKYLLEHSFSIHSMNITPGDKIEHMRKTIEITYKAFNALKYNFGVFLSRYERSVFSYINSDPYFTLPTTPKKEDIYIPMTTDKISVDLSLAQNEEAIFPGSVIELVSIFKEYTMTIYDALLNDMRILFIGEATTSCNTLSKCVFATLNLVGPFAFSFIKRLHPYKNLYDLDFLNVHNCVYAVTNPIFKSKTDSWDVLCEVETGKIAISDRYEQISHYVSRDSDKEFIKEVINKINFQFINEYEVQSMFAKYTYHLLKIAGEKYFVDDEDLKREIDSQSKRKIKMNMATICKVENEYEKLRSLVTFNGASFNVIERHVNNLYFRKMIEKEEMGVIYSDIENFVSGGEFYISLFLSLVLMISHDFQFFLNGIFSKHTEVKQKVRKIYNILCQDKNGVALMKKVNYLYLMKLNELEEVYDNINENGKEN